MQENSFAQRILDPKHFNILVEFTCPAGRPPRKILDFLEAFEKEPPDWENFEITAITVTQSPSGVVTASPGDVFSHLKLSGGLRGLEYIPHVTAKGMNQAEIETFLAGLLSFGVETCFVVTGDRPVGAAPVFELDSLSLLQTIRRRNADTILDAGPQTPPGILWPGVAVGLAKYEEASCLQQLIKLEKKIRFGKAGFVITNLIFDARKVEEFFRYMKERDLDVPVFGNVFFLHEPAARRMLDEKLPGVYVSRDLYETVHQEDFDDHIRRAAQQVAMWKDLGAAGVDLGNVEDLSLMTSILDLAKEIGPDWRDNAENVTFPPPGENHYYIYTPDGDRSPLREPVLPARRRLMHWVHDRFFEEGARGHELARYLFQHSASIRQGKGLPYQATLYLERLSKELIAECQHCGDCFLPENFNVCVMGECSKGLPNVPCGDSTIDGHCGLEKDKLCAGQLVYDAARYFSDDLTPLLEQVNPPKDPALRHTSSLRNYYLELDHRKRPPLILVAELFHSTIPKVKQAFEMILSSDEGFRSESPGVKYLRSVVESQAVRHPHFIDANVDEVGQGDSDRAAGLMREAVRLIVEESDGIPPCIDSSDPVVIRAGLEEYYRLRGRNAPQPLLNSANRERCDFVWDLLSVGPFNLVYMLMGSTAAAGLVTEPAAPEQLEEDAVAFFRAAQTHGFEPGQVFFDTTVMPLSIEFSRFEGSGFNYASLEGLRRIMQNEEMKGVNSILGITNVIRDFPQGRKIGVVRAYLQLAMEAGLTAAIVDVRREFGTRGPDDEEIVDIVRAFTGQDGSPGAYDRMNKAYELYKGFGVRRS
jgi:methylenetetrahydrofolate reductase (NADPH)